MKFYLALLSVLLAGFSVGSPTTRSPNPGTRCSTPICRDAAKRIREALDTTANPCDNFFQYACGGFNKRTPVPASKDRITSFDILNDQMIEEVRKALNFIKPEFNSIGNEQPYSVRFAKYLYDPCLHANNDPKVKVWYEELFEVIGGWKIGLQRKESNLPAPWYQNYVKAWTQLALSPAFTISVAPDAKNVGVKVINIDPSQLGLGDHELQNPSSNAQLISAYKKYLSANGKIFCENNCAQLEENVEEILEMEKQLAKNKMSVEDQRNPEKVYNKYKLSDLAKLTKFDWRTNVLNPILSQLRVGYQLTDSDEVIVSDPNYLTKAIEILADPQNTRAFDNYLGWQIAQAYGPYATEQLREIQFQFLKVKNGIKSIPERWKTCYSLVYDTLPIALSKLFVENYFSTEEKEAASNVISQIQEAYEKLVTTNDWLDETTRKASLSKLRKVRKNVAYPLWLRDNAEVDKFYGLDQPLKAAQLLETKNYLLSLVSFSLIQKTLALENLHSPVDLEKNWPMPPAIINAAYEPEQNSITIPAGILKAPFFQYGRPESLNFGGIGVVIGHEFTHGLDDEGRQFDEAGNLKSWWSKEAIEKFTTRSQCFVKQYSSQQEPTTKLHLNGQNTLGENIADNGGVREAYQALQDYIKRNGPPMILADLPQYSAEQLFFISFANTWCSNYRPEALKQQIEYDPHSPSQYRVNIPLSNSVDFAKAFQCSEGSRMHPTDRCLLW